MLRLRWFQVLHGSWSVVWCTSVLHSLARQVVGRHLSSEHLGARHPCQVWVLVHQVFNPKPLQAEVFLVELRWLWFFFFFGARQPRRSAL